MNETDLNSRRRADDEVVFTAPSSRHDVNRDGTRNIAAATSGVCRSEALVNILIVEDEPKNLTVLESILDEPGYRLVRAASAEQTLLALFGDEFALLILDVRMPGVTGFELVQIIKARTKTANVPIIFVTAYCDDDQHLIEAYEEGAVDDVKKPVRPPFLRSKSDLLWNSIESGAISNKQTVPLRLSSSPRMMPSSAKTSMGLLRLSIGAPNGSLATRPKRWSASQLRSS